MVAPLDIFSVKDGHPKRLGCAETLPKVLLLAVDDGEGLYFVFSQGTGNKQFYKVGSDGAVQASPDYVADNE